MNLERFQAKWIPLCVKRTRQNKKIEIFRDSETSENALDFVLFESKQSSISFPFSTNDQDIMTDRIIVNRIALFAHHGLHAAEAKLGQRFFVSLDVGLDLSEAGRSDDWHRTICYAQLTRIVQEVSDQQRFRIIEGFAEAIADAILATMERADRITVRIDKPSAPVPAILDGVAVEITRHRPRRS